MPDDTSPAYSARPTVKIGGQTRDLVSDRLLSAIFEEASGGLGTLELRFLNLASDDDGDARLAFDDDNIMGLGKDVELLMGDQDNPTSLFKGKISAVEELHGSDGPPEIMVLAEDPLMKARLARRTAVHEAGSLANLVSDVAGRIGLSANTNGLSGDAPLTMQLNESDLAFLRRVLAGFDADVFVVGTELRASQISNLNAGELELHAATDLTRTRVCADLAHQVTAVTVSGWDDSQGDRIGVTSSTTSLGPGSGRPGSSAINDAFGERKAHVGQIPVATSGEAQALADAAFAARARSFVRLEATSSGNPQIRLGTRIRLRGVGSRFQNTYGVVRAIHRYDLTRGYETDIEAECAYFGGNS